MAIKKIFKEDEKDVNLQLLAEKADMALKTRESISQLINEPSKNNLDIALQQISNDKIIGNQRKIELLDKLKIKYVELLNFDNCPDDYDTLKHEIIFLYGVSHYSFLLMAQRLLKIREDKLYLSEIDENGNKIYLSFENFITNGLKISKTVAYESMNVYECFGVRLTELGNDIEYTKLVPIVPLLKSINSEIPKEEIKEKYLKEIKNKSQNEIRKEAKELKIKYGLLKRNLIITDEYDKIFNPLYKKLNEKISDEDIEKIEEHISRIKNIILKNKN